MSQLTENKKTWLNNKRHESLRKPLSEFSFVDDYIYFIAQQFDQINIDGPTYTYGSASLGNIIVIRRDSKTCPIIHKIFDTGYKPLNPDHEFIINYSSVSDIIQTYKKQVALKNINPNLMSLNVYSQ